MFYANERDTPSEILFIQQCYLSQQKLFNYLDTHMYRSKFDIGYRLIECEELYRNYLN